MDQAVLNSVKVSQKLSFYYGLYSYCETHGFEGEQFNNYLKQYSVYDAIVDINKGWSESQRSPFRNLLERFFQRRNGWRLQVYLVLMNPKMTF